MPDGLPGLSFSEMGAAVKKAGQQVKKTGNQVGQQVKQQIGGTFVPGQSVQLPSVKAPGQIAPNQAGGYDIGSIFNEKNQATQQAAKQVTQQHMQDPKLIAQMQEQKAKEQQQIEA